MHVQERVRQEKGTGDPIRAVKHDRSEPEIVARNVMAFDLLAC